MSAFGYIEMSAFGPRKLTGRRLSGAGGCDGCNGTDHDDDARAGPIQGHSVADGKLKPWRAAERLALTTRQVRRLVARLREHGPAGLVSGHRSKPGNRRLGPGTADRALSIIRDRYADFGPTLACEERRECHGIRLVKKTARKLMTDAGLSNPRRQNGRRKFISAQAHRT